MLQPHFYLGPIEVTTDENSALAAIWHSHALQRYLNFNESQVMSRVHAGMPESLLSEYGPFRSPDFFLPALQLGLTIDHKPISMEAHGAQFPGTVFGAAFLMGKPTVRMISVAECLGIWQ